MFKKSVSFLFESQNKVFCGLIHLRLKTKYHSRLVFLPACSKIAAKDVVKVFFSLSDTLLSRFNIPLQSCNSDPGK